MHIELIVEYDTKSKHDGQEKLLKILFGVIEKMVKGGIRHNDIHYLRSNNQIVGHMTIKD